MKVLGKLNIKRGNVYAESLANQSYWYRLGNIWINTLLIEDKRNTSLNPFRWSAADVLWIVFFAALSLILVFLVLTVGWVKAHTMKDAAPAEFDWGGKKGKEWSTDYTTEMWYYDNGKIEVKQ